MPPDIAQLRRHLQAFDLPRLFVEELGWNHYPTRPISIQVDGTAYSLEPAAEKAGFVVYSCSPSADGTIPAYPHRRKVERQAAKVAYEHLIIFVDDTETTQIWQWVKREQGKPALCHEQEYRKGQRGDDRAQRLSVIAVDLEEEARVQQRGISAVTTRVQQAFDVEKVTKKFYDLFKSQLETFRGFIEGITAQDDREWYASLMLNRMMFVYFIQKQGFLDGDLDYLRDRLKRVQEQSGEGRFQQFYRLFLLRLFHEGLGQPETNRASDLAELLGKVPYLNGGLFDVHDLERGNPDIQIPDEAFERLFDFFDAYRWHLDERPHRADNEINPDVLGYIFEKYINQKQMGAYYTKEDITGYIAQNTIIPFLFEAARKECPVAFAPDGGMWRLLKDDPDRYIYPAVGHGIAWDVRQQPPARLEVPYELPGEIANGIDDVSKRDGWNRAASEEFALPKEIWREVAARRQRYQEVRGKLAEGGVHDVNGLITLNLDICQFAYDVIAQSEGPELVRAFWHALQRVTVLDPACGSGAFLFAALQIMEPLYTACLEGMQGFLDDLEWSHRRHHPEALRDFRTVLEEVAQHPNRPYYTLKSIVINNLYGVDIMEEAVEICKLRLFLKLVAQVETYDQIEPLPDIDFNIRAGNSLVGFTSLDAVQEAMTVAPDGQYRMLDEEQKKILRHVEADAELADQAFHTFQEMQTQYGMDAREFIQTKVNLRLRLDGLRQELDRYLAAEYGIELQDGNEHQRWQASHQPFHWFVEFYRIMASGGFDIVIGNPPYIEYSKIRHLYSVSGYETEMSNNLYGFMVERAFDLLRKTGRWGFILPVSFASSEALSSVRHVVLNKSRTLWLSHFANRPSQLFSGAQNRLTIAICGSDVADRSIFSTRYHRWDARGGERDALLPLISYVDISDPETRFHGLLPKVGSIEGVSVLRKLTVPKIVGDLTSRVGAYRLYWVRVPGYFCQFFLQPPMARPLDGGAERIRGEVNSIALHD